MNKENCEKDPAGGVMASGYHCVESEQAGQLLPLSASSSFHSKVLDVCQAQTRRAGWGAAM